MYFELKLAVKVVGLATWSIDYFGYCYALLTKLPLQQEIKLHVR